MPEVATIETVPYLFRVQLACGRTADELDLWRKSDVRRQELDEALATAIDCLQQAIPRKDGHAIRLDHSIAQTRLILILMEAWDLPTFEEALDKISDIVGKLRKLFEGRRLSNQVVVSLEQSLGEIRIMVLQHRRSF